MRRWIACAGLLALLGVAACNTGSKSDESETDTPRSKKSKPDKSVASSTVQTGAKPVALTAQPPAQPAPTAVPASPVSPAALPADGIPDIPDSRSNPPTVAEWQAAPEVNTQGAGGRPKDCNMRVVREWLNIHCNGKVTKIDEMDGFGKENWDYYQQITLGSSADFVVRLRKGVSMKLKIFREDQDAALFVSWPPSEPKPKHIALGIGRR
jgi:hypothetical protein